MQDQDQFQNTGSGDRSTATLAEKSREATASVKQKAQQTRERVLEKGSEAVHQAKDKTRAFAEDRKSQLGERIHGYGSAVRRAADKLRDEEDPNIAHYADVVAEKLDQAADYVQSRDPGMILRDVERAARRRPEIFFGGMFLAGLVLSRFLKASSERDSSYSAESDEDYWVEDSSEDDSALSTDIAGTSGQSSDQPYATHVTSENDWRASNPSGMQPGSSIQPGGTI
jgi:hypothetical protein